MVDHVPLCVTFDRDPSASECALAKSLPHRNLEVASEIGQIAGRSFNVITLTAVWMEWRNAELCRGWLSEIRSLLAPSGVLFATVTHPCFRDHAHATFRTDFPAKSYLCPGTPFEATVLGEDERSAQTFNDFHWNFEAMFSQLKDCGLYVDELFEMPDIPSGRNTGLSPWVILRVHLRHCGRSG